jgi:hypothetical protein
MFKPAHYLENMPYLIDKKTCEYEAFVKGYDYGFIILVYSDYAELYEFNDGPHMFLGKYDSFEDATDASNNFC